ncbi:MAG: hydroxyacid dehydrogenase [Bdellovibrionales bacterium]|jgi:D-3-phosphoglycerate dehydrogenase / 2-oxoglutarate reductase|nr:hydroxyacid dehydrogenase [Bdellovibrionales bacterium]MBT3525174.1 hydroxyacid dehydrogenase [Bdellovibrionales bacterium]MBT7767876.1 hydroxyacid dehydrogenase [Bdellovibrionales bacterium]
MKILVSDKMSNKVEDVLKAKGVDYEIKTGMTPEELKGCIDQYDGILIRSATKLKAEILDGCKNLKVVGRAGVGVDNVDLDVATKHKILVMNTPLGNMEATAELSVGLVFSLMRHIHHANPSTHQGKWEKSKFMGTELKGKTVGIIGFGNIGQRVAEMLGAIGMNVITNSSSASAEDLDRLRATKVSLDQLIAQSDVISLHTKLSDDTRDMFNSKTLKAMKNSAILINCARGGLIHEADLKSALESGEIAGVAIDVYPTEPAKENVLFGVENALLTPHLGASSKEAQINVAVDVATQVADYLLNGTIINNVNSLD